MSVLSLNIGAQQVQKQSLVITPQLQHAISILQMNNVELEKHLEELSESNPFLEVKGVNSEARRKVEIDYRSALHPKAVFQIVFRRSSRRKTLTLLSM